MKFNIIIIYFLCLSTSVLSQTSKGEPDIFLNEKLLSKASFNVKFIESIDYTKNGLILLSSIDQFYLVGIGGIIPLFEKTKLKIENFSVATEDSTLLAINNKTLYRVDSSGSFVKLMTLPNEKMAVYSGKNKIYLYDKFEKRNKTNYSIYAIDKLGRLNKLVSIQSPISSIFEYNAELFFSSQKKVYHANDITNQFSQLIDLNQEKENIISITGDYKHNTLYLSTKNTLLRVNNDSLEYLTKEFGGVLKYDGEGLLVFNPDRKLIVRFRNNILYKTGTQQRLPIKTKKDNYLSDELLKQLTLQETRNLVAQNRIGEAIKAYAFQVEKDSTNTDLLAEYSYTLALNGTYDCALMNLDRVRLLSPESEAGDFYTGLVFSTMGYNDLFEEFVKSIPNSKTPKWITFETHSKLISNILESPILNTDDYATSLKRVNHLAAVGLYLQSIALFEEIINEYPKEFLPHIGYSIVLEKVGIYQKAIKELDIAIQLMGNSPAELGSKNVYQEKKRKLEEKSNAPNSLRNKWITYKNNFNPKTMLYIGGMVTNSTVSLDSRFGLYLSNSFNGAADFGLSGDSENFYVNLGLSGYQRFGVFVWGEGLSLQLGNSTVLNLKTSLGLSFINRKGNSSWDIFFDWYLPINQELKSTYGISIGKSIYFGKRK